MRSGHADVTQTTDPGEARVESTIELEKVQDGGDQSRVGHVRRSLDRVRGSDGSGPNRDSREERESLRLEVMLLREEIARLRTARHRPADIGTLIDQLRALAAEQGEAEMEDEVWTLIAGLSALREGLEQACVELELAITSIRQRLRTLSVGLDQQEGDGAHALDSTPSTPQPAAGSAAEARSRPRTKRKRRPSRHDPAGGRSRQG